ncbi:MAG: peptidase [bacterium]
MSVLFIFIDGIGIGEFNQTKNPFARFFTPYLSIFSNHTETSVPLNGIVVQTDPAMGVKGLPQSATGQTALLTGINASKILGRHASGFPSPTLRNILAKESIFLKLQKMGKTATFANAFTPEYFQRSNRQISATTWSVRASHFPFRMLNEDLLHDRAISHDLTNEFLARLGYAVPIRSAEQSAEILANISETIDFCLFEYILTDFIGHQQDMAWAKSELQKLTTFLKTVLNRIDLSEHLVLISSDHGNFEDLSVATHTHNFVPTVLWGKGRMRAAKQITRIEDVSGAILDFFENESE